MEKEIFYGKIDLIQSIRIIDEIEEKSFVFAEPYVKKIFGVVYDKYDKSHFTSGYGIKYTFDDIKKKTDDRGHLVYKVIYDKDDIPRVYYRPKVIIEFQNKNFYVVRLNTYEEAKKWVEDFITTHNLCDKLIMY